ncbi:MAG: hypothetical protein HW416_2381 [Chloroflexi bacterium]|nr:hypothetical protein [Chloroflexota bacterium]
MGWDALANAAYWTTEFIGAGLYRLDRWTPGTSIEGSAFDGHVLGRARIDRVRIQFVSDANAALATLLSGAIQLAADNALGFQQGLTAKQQWASNGGGQMLFTTDLWRAIYPQFRPEVAGSPAVLDLRVRRALGYVIDKQSVNEVLYGGEGILAETILPPGVDYSATVDRAITHYPYDPRRTEQIMTEAGYARSSGGFFSRPGEERPTFELKTNASVQYEQETSIVAAGWRQSGFDVREAVNPAALAGDGQTRATFPSFFAFSTNLGERALGNFRAAEIPRTENRWTGNNRGGWANPEYDRLFGVLNSTLDRTERIEQISRLAKLLTDELPAFSLYYDLSPVAHTSALQGPGPISPDTTGLMTWNAVEWELR